MRELRFYGDPVLRRHTSPVKRFDPELAALAEDMIDLMYVSRGIGLAAPQVGVLRRLIVVDTSDERDEAIVMVNPRIIRRSGEETDSEGCLSIPRLQVEVPRATEIEVTFQDLEEREHTIRGRGLWARVVQHEVDHLNGRLITDYMEPGDRERFEEDWPAMLEQELARRQAAAEAASGAERGGRGTT